MSKDRTTPPINVDYFEDLTGDIQSSPEKPEGDCDQIGLRIKKMREDKGLSIANLAQLTGFDEEMLENIEKGDVCPQLGTAIKLSKVLDSALHQLISNEGVSSFVVTRQDEFKEISRSTSQRGQRSAYTYMSLAPEVKGRHMEPLMVNLEPVADQERSVHDGEELIYVLEGTVALTIGKEHFVLNPGDSAYYLSTTPHLVAAAKEKAKILAVIYSA